MENNRCFGCMAEKHSHPICEHCGWDERRQNDDHQLPVGTILRGQYLVGRVLGQGGFGITYLGWDMYLDMPVAIKEYFPSGMVTRDVHLRTSVSSYTGTAGADYEANKNRFMREGKALARFEDLQHIVRVYSFFPENNTVYMVMEYARGRTLLETLKREGPMTLPRILDILGPIMEDLQQVHETGLVHRDISPDNVMLLEKGGAKLLDFGAVRVVDNPDQEVQLSHSTQAILKQGFAPVEQYNGRGSLGPWTDVYAMCATICYCLNGRLPQSAPDRTIDDDPEGFIRILPIREDQKAILARGMAIRPKDRIPSMERLLKELRDTLSGETGDDALAEELRREEPRREEARREEARREEVQKEEHRQEKARKEKENGSREPPVRTLLRFFLVVPLILGQFFFTFELLEYRMFASKPLTVLGVILMTGSLVGLWKLRAPGFTWWKLPEQMLSLEGAIGILTPAYHNYAVVVVFVIPVIGFLALDVFHLIRKDRSPRQRYVQLGFDGILGLLLCSLQFEWLHNDLLDLGVVVFILCLLGRFVYTLRYLLPERAKKEKA